MSLNNGSGSEKQPNRMAVRVAFAAMGLVLLAVVLAGATSYLSLKSASRGQAPSQDLQATASLLGHKVVDSQWNNSWLPSRTRDNLMARSAPAGLFPSSISVRHFITPLDRSSFAGRALLPLLYLPDNNMFVTVLVLQCLLEAEQLGVVGVDDEVVLSAVEAILDHRDRNLPEDVSAYCFYSQKQTSNGTWHQHPTNICRFAGYVSTFGPPIYHGGQWMGITPANEEVFRAPDIRDLVVHGDPRGFLNRFNMPADSDDTGLALILGAALAEGHDRYPEAHDAWVQLNRSPQPAIDILKKYAYRPDSSDPAVSVIDPRTYFWLREWLDGESIEDPALITTWMQHVYEGQGFDDRRSKMPLNVNNVDPTVASNMLAGLASALLSSCTEEKGSLLLDEDTAKIVRDTGNLISWVISSNIPSRANDTALLYYPTRGTFYWSAARLLRQLEEAPCELPDPFDEIAIGLAAALRGPGTKHLLAEAQREDDRLWWPGVLPGGEDRLFATVLVTNALIDAWTHRTSGTTPILTWDPSTPNEVVTTVHQAIAWAQDTIEAEPYPWLNACFSGSVKGVNTLPFFFPTNTVETHGSQGFHGVRGHIPEDEYNAMLGKCEARLQSGRLGERSPAFTHWCSPTLTRAVTMLAIAKAARLEDHEYPHTEATSL